MEKPEVVRQRIKETREWIARIGKEAQKRWMRLGSDLQIVRDKVLWKDWRDGKGRKFPTFDDYVQSEVGVSKSKVYYLLSVADNLKLPPARLEDLGKTKCYELARVAQERPKEFPRILQRIEKDPEMTVNEVRDIVESAIAGRAVEHYTRLDFAVKEGDVQTIVEALAVMQAQEPVENSDSASGRGVHLVNICREYLTDEEAIEVLKGLKKAGFFKKVPFELEG